MSELSGRTRAQRIGDDAEAAVAGYLAAIGWTVLGRNVHGGRPEIDILAVDPGWGEPWLVAVEVRARGRRDFGLAEESLDYRKRARLRAALGRILLAAVLPDGHPVPDLPVRLDLVVVEGGEMRHHRAVG